MKPYWTCYKNKMYISGFDANKNPIFTLEENNAYRFYDFNEAMSFFNQGFNISREEEEICYSQKNLRNYFKKIFFIRRKHNEEFY